MPKAKTPSFIVTLLLRESLQFRRRADASFQAATRLTNVMTQEARRMVAALRADPDWALARGMPRKTLPQREARQQAFQALRKRHGFSEFEFHRRIAQHKRAAGFADRLGANVVQKIATRVFKAFHEYVLGQRGLPRFKGALRPVRSLEEKAANTGIRWDPVQREMRYGDLRLPVVLPDLKQDEWLAFALDRKTKYCRLLWKNVHGEKRYYLQLIQEGVAPRKQSVAERLAPENTVGGIDIGPSSIAWVTDTAAGLTKFCPRVVSQQKRLRVLQRKLDRQRRANNPGCYDDKGRILPGRRAWVKSSRYLQTQAKLQAIQSKLARQRQNEHGILANDLMSHARSWRDDGVSVRSLQKHYGKSIGARAPGSFLTLLTRKAESAGGSRMVQNARELKTSQYDHTTDTYAKKPLSQRWHVFGDGSGTVQRDLYSAFLARNAVQTVDEDGVIGWRHDPEVLRHAWALLVPTLQEQGWYRCEGQASDPRATAVQQSSHEEGGLPTLGAPSPWSGSRAKRA